MTTYWSSGGESGGPDGSRQPARPGPDRTVLEHKPPALAKSRITGVTLATPSDSDVREL